MKKQRTECPTKCNGKERVRQLSEGQFERIQQDIKEKQLPPLEFQANQLWRCFYCGCVFEGAGGKQLGWLDGSMIGMGWHPLGRQ
jgi:hypothetical protein